MKHTLDESTAVFDVMLPARPYPGLRPFEKHEWPIFFGRERMIDEVITRIVDQRLLVVHGDSGSGKSSLVKAGVLARLEQESARGGLAWHTCEMQPREAPLHTLARSLAHLDGPEVDPARVLEIRRVLNFGADAPGALARLVRRGEWDHVCILIDQFEELFAFARRDGREEASLFVQFLAALLNNPCPGLYAIATMRSEFLGVCAQFPGLAEAVNRAQYLLPRMAHSDLVRAIREPACIYGGQVTRDLAERLIADGADTQDELPLIQHGLMLLYESKISPAGSSERAWRLDLADYEDALRELHDVGGLEGLLSTHADKVAKAAEPSDGVVVERLFRALTDINAEGQAIRRPQSFAQLVGITDADKSTLGSIINTFRAKSASFLRPYGDDRIFDDTLIDISHEALIRSWRQIANPKDGWLTQEFQDGLLWKLLLLQTEDFERDPSRILPPSTAQERKAWLQQRSRFWAERYGGNWDRVTRFVSRSAAAARRHEAARKWRMVVVVALAAVFAGMWWTARRNRNEAIEQRLTSESLANAALARENIWLAPELATKYALEALKTKIPNTQDAAKAVLQESNVLAVWHHPGFAPITAAGFSPDGEQVVLSNAHGKAWLWTWKTCREHNFPNYPMLPLRATAFTPDGKSVLSEEREKRPDGTEGGYVIVVRPTNGGKERRFEPQTAPITAVVSFDMTPDRHYIATGSLDSSVKVWDLDGDLRNPEKTLVRSAPGGRTAAVVGGGHTDIVTSVRFAPADTSGQRDAAVVTASQDGRSKVWHWETGVVETLRARTWILFDSTASPRQPHLVASGNVAGDLFIWTLLNPPRTREYENPRRVFAHKNDVREVSFSPNGKYIVTASVDGTAKVWDWMSGKEVLPLKGHRGAVTSADFSPDPEGQTIVTSSVDGTVRVWRNMPPVTDLTQRPPAHSCVGQG